MSTQKYRTPLGTFGLKPLLFWGFGVELHAMNANLKKLPLFVALVLTTACFNQNARAAKTLVHCSEGSPSGFNPQLVTDGTSNDASAIQLYNRLVTFKHGETTIIPSLASSWKVSKDGKTYTFKLRKGVKFHTTKWFTPSREFNADDVLFSFNRQRLKSHPYNKVSGGTYEYFDSMDMPKIIKDIVKIDDHTVRFDLSRPEAPFLANVAMEFASILFC